MNISDNCIAEDPPEQDSVKNLKALIEKEKQLEQESFAAEKNSNIVVRSCRDFLDTDFPGVTPLIGGENDALLVRGEALMIAGTGGVGKTLYITSTAASLAIGEDFLRWSVPKPLKTLIYQAELPQQFYHLRLKSIYESYKLANADRAEGILDNVYIAQVNKAFNIAAKDDTASEVIGADVERYSIDIVIIDPFLSFFQGNENDNNEVRRALDNLKYGVAEKYRCGLILTDHQPKYSNSDKNKEQKNSMRGAGAKRDWAASVIALNKMGTPKGQYGTFIKATVDKMRYGKEPQNPFSLRRDDFSFRHLLYKENDVELHEIAQILDDAGGNLNKGRFQAKVEETFSLGFHDSRAAIERAVDENWIVTSPGSATAIMHNLGEKYLAWRDK